MAGRRRAAKERGTFCLKRCRFSKSFVERQCKDNIKFAAQKVELEFWKSQVTQVREASMEAQRENVLRLQATIHQQERELQAEREKNQKLEDEIRKLQLKKEKVAEWEEVIRGNSTCNGKDVFDLVTKSPEQFFKSIVGENYNVSLWTVVVPSRDASFLLSFCFFVLFFFEQLS